MDGFFARPVRVRSENDLQLLSKWSAYPSGLDHPSAVETTRQSWVTMKCLVRVVEEWDHTAPKNFRKERLRQRQHRIFVSLLWSATRCGVSWSEQPRIYGRIQHSWTHTTCHCQQDCLEHELPTVRNCITIHPLTNHLLYNNSQRDRERVVIL